MVNVEQQKSYHLSGSMDLDKFSEAETKSAQEALSLGFDVIVSTPSTLLLDMDDYSSMSRFRSIYNRSVFSPQIIVEAIAWPSKSGNIHIKLDLLGKMTVQTRIFRQLTLGSDPVRESLSALKVAVGIPDPIRLFRPPDVGDGAPIILICADHGYKALTKKYYLQSLKDADDRWRCPECRITARLLEL